MTPRLRNTMRGREGGEESGRRSGGEAEEEERSVESVNKRWLRECVVLCPLQVFIKTGSDDSHLPEIFNTTLISVCSICASVLSPNLQNKRLT